MCMRGVEVESCTSVSVCLSVCAYEQRCPWRPETLDFPEAGDISYCELIAVGAGNQIGSFAREVCAAVHCCIVSLAPGGGSFDLPFKASWRCALSKSKTLPSRRK